MKYKLKRWFQSFILLIWKSLDKTIPILMKIFMFLKIICYILMLMLLWSIRQGNTNFPNMMSLLLLLQYCTMKWLHLFDCLFNFLRENVENFVLTILLHLKEFFHRLKEFINLSHRVLQLNQILVEVPVPIITINLCWSASENV